MRTIILISILLTARVGDAATVAVGTLSYDVFLPGSSDGPGVNIFSIANLTGDPASSGFALPPELPAFTPITFLNARLDVTGDVNQQIPLGDLSPGFFTPFELAFSETVHFTSAVLIAKISPLTLVLNDGSLFHASDAIRVELGSSTGLLVAGASLSVIELSDDQGDVVPEPAATVPLACLFTVAGMYRHRRRRSQNSPQ
jgi:hypothetical protein